MYKDYLKFYNYEVLEYGRKSRADDPLLSVEEVLERHGKILEEYAINNTDRSNYKRERRAVWN